MRTGIILSVFLSVCVWQTHGQTEQKLGDLTFVCKEGWRIYQSDCYMEVDVMMTWDDAKSTCQRQGGDLIWIKNEMEYDFVKTVTAEKTFWTGLQYVQDTNTSEWSHDHTAVDLKSIAVWGENEPNENGETRCAASQGEKLALKSCSLKLPFVCKYEACHKGYMPCATGGKCFTEQDKCDGRNDCDDMSDERDCRTSGYCSYYYKLNETLGNFSTARVDDGTWCSYVLEAPIGKQIKLTVPRLISTLEEGVATLEIWAGSPDIKDSDQLAELTGPVQEDDFISQNNFMTVLLRAGDLATSSRPGITLKWTTAIPEIFDGVREETATASWKSLTPTFTKERTPMETKLSWKIIAPSEEVIMYYLDSYDKSEGTSLRVQEGPMAEDPTRIMDPDSVKRVFYGSAANTIQVHWNSGYGMSSFNLQYKTGCNMEIDEAVGAFSVPIFWETSDRYPSNLKCEWVLTGGQAIGRGLTVHFILIDLDEDPRQDKASKDQIKLYNQTAEIASIGNSQSDGRHHAESGYMKVEFESDLMINDGVGFTAKFSVDCPPLNVSEWTRRSVDSVMSETNVTLSCQIGYKFDAEEYYGMDEVELYCKEGGTWTYNDKADIRIPNCQVVQCGFPTEIQNGYILNATGSTHGKTAKYMCNDGFAISHIDPATCDENGIWQNRPTCGSATCAASDIQGIPNGDFEVEAGNNITSTSVDFNTVIKFVCDPGYELHGSLRSHCRHDGWSDRKPECHSIECPLPLRDNVVGSETSLKFGQSREFSCKSGYGINGTGSTSVTVTCESNRMTMPPFECLDINECDSNPCDTTTTRCENNDGGHKCICLDGFESSGSTTSCSDIKECNVDKGGCSHTCNELVGSYECLCPSGWTLFIADGTSGFVVPNGESGYQFGDVYYYNHTCVKKSCDHPGNVAHGTLLSSKTLFHYQDSVELVCDDGYHITGSSETTTRMTRTCTDSGWSVENITCSARTCTTPSVPVRGSYDRDVVNFREKVTLTCKWTETENITRTAICLYDRGATRFVGHDITVCPAIDCGNPEDPLYLPSGGRVIGTVSTKHLDHETFTFDCLDGYTRLGTSEITDNQSVTCKENGRWSFGTLRCLGATCIDPGTPAEAKQLVVNYEVGKTLHYTCDRNGYVPVPDLNYTCEYSVSAGRAIWSDNLESNLPKCVDKTNPMIKNLPTATVYRDRMETANIPDPAYSDNFGVKSVTVSESIRSTDIITVSKTINYIAEDYDNNVETVAVNIQVIDRTSKPSLNCPEKLEVEVSSLTSEVYNVTQHVISDGTLQFSKETVTVSVDKIGTAERIDVTAKNEFGTESYCSFLVTFKAVKCFKDTLYPDSNAMRSCIGSGDGFTCSSKCNSGFVYGDGKDEKNFTCTGNNDWDVSYPHVFCLPTESPAYQFTAYVTHDYQYVNTPCLPDYEAAIRNRRSTFESQMRNLCSQIRWQILSETSSVGQSSSEFKSEFTVKLLDTDITEVERATCIESVRSTLEIFNLANNELYCTSAPGSFTIDTTNVAATNGSFECVTETYFLIDLDTGKKCIPCGPGRFYVDSNGGECTSCPAGQYQDQVDGSCKECDAGETGNTQGTDCIITCPAGFRSDDGLLPCAPCGVDKYWADSKTCTPCDSGTSTSGRKGAVDISGCYSSCPAGKYSRTGYEDWTCNACPRNFYQPNIGSTTCVECPDNQVTDDNSQNSSASCHDYNSFGAGESCNRAYCNDHGDCGFQFHRPVCTCDGGFTGERCDTSFDICNRNYNNFNPCMNDAECVPGTTYTDFTCVCKEEVDRDLCFPKSFRDKEGGSVGVLDYPTVNSLEQCQDACLAREDCLGVTYYILSANKLCLLFNKTFSEGDLVDKAGRTHYNRDCPPVYDGARCENDLVNDCNNSRCSSDAMCKDEVLGYECLCPSEGGYQGTYCNQVEKPCTSNPCIHGSCHDFDYVRYECTCDAGYTGVNCDTDISDCDMNPNACPYGGNCSDRVNAYQCECPAMFSGENCENTPNYCESKYCLGNLCYNSLDDRSGKCECEGPYYIDSGLGDWACNSTAAQPCDFVTCINGTCDTQARCNCEAGFTGSQCQHSIDDCTDTSCSNNGRCIDEHMDFSCECPVGFTGSRCETNMDDCANQCGSHGNCVDGIDSYTCVCDPGYTGTECETDINECLAYPCQHGGACNDSENKYICTCQEGWTGTNCEDWNEYCNPSPCKNDGVCYSLTGSRICRCGGGTQGEFCDNKTSVCDTLQHVPVCVNGGTCKDIGGTAECQCPIVPAMDRCFTTVHKDKEGGSDSLILPRYANIDLEACKQKCLDNADCQSLSYHTIGSNKFCSIYSRKIPTTLVDEVGGVHIEKNCPTDYDGAACELAEDWCANNPCQNGGSCFTKDPRGFRCDCETGYSGATCGVEADPCQENSCPSGATCRSTVTDYYCQCPMGREITGSTCRTTYEKTVLLLADAPDPAMDMVRRKRHSHGGGGTFYSVPEDIPTLKTPFRMSGGTFSVMFSIRIHKPKSAGVYNLLRLVGSDKLYPLRDENPRLVLLITNENVRLTYDMETVTLDLEEPLERAKWYHIGVALASNRELSYTIDAVEVSDPQPLPGASVLNFDDLNAQVVLGDTDMVAEFKLVTVWETALSNSEFAQASANEQYTPEGATLTQGWYNYNLPKTTKLLTQELKSDLYSEDKSVPSISCDNSPYERVSGDRILRRSSLTDLTTRINSVHGNGSVSMHSIPVDLTWGYYSAVVVVKANSRFAECRFPVYIKYNDQCPAPEDDSDVVITYCDNTGNDGVCGLKCSALSEYVSAPTPKYRACGVLGVYYWDKPYENLVLPTCAAGSSPRNVVEIFMQYDFKIDCGPFLDSEEIKAAVKKIFLSLNTSWSDICEGAGCTNLKFMKVECNSAMSKRLDLMFSLEFFSGTLTALRDEGGSLVNDGQMNLADALESIIVIEEKIDLSRFASAVLIKTSVMVTVKKDCTTFGYNLINNICVPCGKGLVYDDGLKRCVSCPRGKYKDMNDNECKSCGSEKTTVYVGSTSQDDCVDYCDAGRFYDTARGSCQNCPRHAYQDKPGQSFCHPCELGYKTQGDGSSSPLDCKEDCPAGYDRNASGVCSVCERGYWRDLLADDCQQCDTGKTTIPGEIAISKDKCEMDVCPVGRFWNITVQDCMDCPAGKYQDEHAMLDCKPCDGNKTTKNPTADSASMCVFYCAAGYEVNPNETDACLPCRRGYYKDNMGSSKFDNCTQCVDSTTDDIAAESVNKCEYEICDRGQVLENKVCIDCDENFYQPILMVDSTARCIPCPEKAGTPQGTEEKATYYDTDCKPICPGGEQFDDAEMKCVECVMGTYKPDSDRFGNCMNCRENFTTDGNRKTSETECDIPLCAKGDYVKDKFCTKCDYDTYQPDLHPAAGVVCTECPVRNGVKMGTKELGADSESYCKPVCPGGYEYDEEGDGCIECPVGRYKPDTREDRFEPCYSCPTGFTNNGTRKLSNESCTIRDCPPGSYDDDTTCVLCPLGSYQDKPTKKKCEECGTNLNTSRMGANSSAECQAFCQAGEQSTTVSQERCEKCPLGKYKASPSYDPCQNCPIDFTSNAERTACTEVFCSAGKEYKNLTSGPGCVPCQIGKYKDTAGNSDCKDCLPGKTTNETGQTSCEILHCKPGEYEVDGQCELCDKGYFKSEHGNDDCTPCAEDKTTEGKGADSEADCNIVICKIGEYREPTQTTACTPCPYNTYQNVTGKTSCIDCPIDQVTMIKSAKTAEDCVPKCMTGKQYNYIKKDCDPCPQRYYKDTVGNFQNCTECPSKKTTVGEGATAETQCNQNDCGPGSYIEVTNNAVTCPLCPVGKYQPESSQVQCESCGPTLTTLKTGSVSQTQCITECEAGNELIFPDTTKCHPCKIGKYNDLSGKNPYKCKPCPGGFTTTAEGKANCTVTVEKPTPAPVVLVRAVFLVVFRVETTCAELSLQIILSSIQNTFRIRMNTRRSRYGGICGINQSNCDRITCSLGTCLPRGRRKRELTHDLEVTVTVPDIPSTVEDSEDNNAVLDTANLLAGILESNPEEFSPNEESIVYGGLTAAPTVTPVCDPGYIIHVDGDRCAPCQPGQHWNQTSETCFNCKTDQYQDEEAQTECKMCPDNTYNDRTASTTENDCKSVCAENPDYCNSRGTCYETGRRTAACRCKTDYSGDRCENKHTPSTNQPAIIGGTIGALAGILVLILIIVAIYRFKFAGVSKERRKHKQSTHYSHHAQEEEYFHNPIYDNRSGAGSVAGSMPAVFSTMPGMEYYGGADPYGIYTLPDKRKNQSHTEPRHQESEYIWQA